MSKFINAVQSRLTGEMKVSEEFAPLDAKCTKEPVLGPEAGLLLSSYEVFVTWRAKGFCKNHAELSYLEERAIRGLKDVVYGEFRSYLHHATIAAYDRDFSTLATILRDLERETR